MTPVPPVPELARIAASGAIFDLIGSRSLPLDRGQISDRLAAAALEAASPAIRADADKRRIPGSELYMAGVTAERERCVTMLRAAAARLAESDPAQSSAYSDAADLIEGES